MTNHESQSARSDATPEFPLRVVFPDGEEFVIERLNGPETELEFYVPGERSSRVVDARGRRVHLRVEACAITECRLIASE